MNTNTQITLEIAHVTLIRVPFSIGLMSSIATLSTQLTLHAPARSMLVRSCAFQSHL